MKVKTLKALKGSIKKWEAIVAGTGHDRGPDNCPLCKMFNNENQAVPCVGCPVAEAAKDDCCGSTPYTDYYHANRAGDAEGATKSARAELDFLKSLLPAACD